MSNRGFKEDIFKKGGKFNRTQAHSQPVFSGKPEGPFCLVLSFSEMKEIR